jgi:PAS domain S-box-containing protein
VNEIPASLVLPKKLFRPGGYQMRARIKWETIYNRMIGFGGTISLLVALVQAGVPSFTIMVLTLLATLMEFVPVRLLYGMSITVTPAVGLMAIILFGTHGLFVLVLPAILQAVQPWQRRWERMLFAIGTVGIPAVLAVAWVGLLYPLGVLLAAIVVCCGPSFLRLGEGIIANGFDGLKRIWAQWRRKWPNQALLAGMAFLLVKMYEGMGIMGILAFLAPLLITRSMVLFDGELQEASIQKNEQWEAVFASCGAGLALLDEKDRLLAVNAAFQEMTGRTHRELQGMSFWGLFDDHRHDRPVLPGRRFRHRLRSGQGFRDVEVVVDQVVLQPESTGALVRKVVTIWDVSRELEQEAARREFMRWVTHDLKTPLATISGFVQLAAAVDEADRSHSYLEEIGKAALDLEEMIERILVLNEADLGVSRQRLTSVNLVTVAKEALARYGPQAAQKGLELKAIFPGNERAMMSGDSIALGHVISNLLSNAIKYSQALGTIVLRIERRPLEVVLEVCDEGQGIPTQHLPRIFERFYRVKGERGVSGSGLGLSIVKGVVEQHHGQVEVESEEGKGTLFRVRFPVHSAR